MTCIWIIHITLGMALSRNACMIPGSTKKFTYTMARYYFISYMKLTIVQTDGYQQKESYVDETKAWCLSQSL
jgi:hypothetical protein